jgi:hypothetical protein
VENPDGLQPEAKCSIRLVNAADKFKFIMSPQYSLEKMSIKKNVILAMEHVSSELVSNVSAWLQSEGFHVILYKDSLAKSPCVIIWVAKDHSESDDYFRLVQNATNQEKRIIFLVTEPILAASKLDKLIIKHYEKVELILCLTEDFKGVMALLMERLNTCDELFRNKIERTRCSAVYNPRSTNLLVVWTPIK